MINSMSNGQLRAIPLKAAAGHDLRFSVRVELGGDKVPSQDVVEAVNQVFSKKVSAKLKLE